MDADQPGQHLTNPLWIPISEDPISCAPHFDVAAEAEDWIVVSKAAPLIVHPSNGKKEPNLLEGVQELLRYEMVNGATLSLINRLDRETSGLTLIAKNKSATRQLGRAMQRREMHKEYLAIAHGWPEWESITCDCSILRQGDLMESRIWVKQTVHPQGKECRTTFHTELRLNLPYGRFSLIRCIPETGRMHQIRVHLSYLGHPIMGDKIYGVSENCYLDYIQHGWSEALQRQLILPRHALHAFRLVFPFDDELISTESPLPEDLKTLLRDTAL